MLRVAQVVRRHDLHTVFVEYILDVGVQQREDFGARTRLFGNGLRHKAVFGVVVGQGGLEDNRGRGKPTEIQTTEERLNAEVETLKARNKWLEMENDALKKRRKIAGNHKSQGLDKKWNI